jgi:hypothetical protein
LSPRSDHDDGAGRTDSDRARAAAAPPAGRLWDVNAAALADHAPAATSEKESRMTTTPHDTNRPARWTRRWPFASPLLHVGITGLAGLSVLLYGFVGTGTTSTASQLNAELAYARCMRVNGVTNYPDPNPDGEFPPFQAHVSIQISEAAQHTCQHLLPHGGGGARTQGDRQKLGLALKVAQCMRRHGYPTYPDPASSNPSAMGSGTRFDGTGIDPKSPLFQAAETNCEKRVRQQLGLPAAK